MPASQIGVACTKCFFFTYFIAFVCGELVWTPILPAQPDQVDLWTVSQSGCSCKDGRRGGGECACCVPRVACPCAQLNPHRCAQCGIQHYCNNMCNMTIDGALLSVSSGTLEGSLISPSNIGPPISCWYSLRAPRGHRVEIQLHRLVHIGTSLNETTCRGGYVEVSDQDRRYSEEGSRYEDRSDVERWTTSDGSKMWKSRNGAWSSRSGQNVIRICGEDQRLHPPIVLYSNSGIATITYRVRDRKGSPRFIAYYNFPPATHPLTGDKQWGGTRIEYTECDWLYQDIHCDHESECHLTSPGFPGIYPSDTKCKYLFTMSSTNVKAKITFISVDLPAERCGTDYLTLYSGTSTSSPLITTLCGRTTETITLNGPNALLLFSSGSFLSPFQFSGFHASIHFIDQHPSSIEKERAFTNSTPPHSATQDTNILSDPSGQQSGDGSGCLRLFWSNSTRSGHFDTSSYAQSHHMAFIGDQRHTKSSKKKSRVCRLRFIGQPDEIVQISFFKYRLHGQSCSSEASIYDGLAAHDGKNLIHHICGPISREPKDSKGRFLQPQFLTSSSNLLEIHLSLAPNTDLDGQFLAGAFQFHSSRTEGTKKPGSVCDVMFYGAHSIRHATLHQPRSALMWNLEGPLQCSYLFVPALNQSLELALIGLSGTRGSRHCSTQCTDDGCQCVTNSVGLDQVDHMKFISSKDKEMLWCLCGNVQDMLPLKILSTSGIDVLYYDAHYQWSSSGLNFSLSYSFSAPSICGSSLHNTPAGLLVPPANSFIPISTYIYAICSWVIESHSDHHLTVVVQPPSAGSCSTWNFTVKARMRVETDKYLGHVCAGSTKGSFDLLPIQSGALVVLQWGGRPVRDWLITWHTRTRGLAIDEEEHFTPKPELSRTLHGLNFPTGRTFIVRSSANGERSLISFGTATSILFISMQRTLLRLS